MSPSARYVTVPGYGGSGPAHWQTHWELDLPAVRFRPASWDLPDARDWADALTRAVSDGGLSDGGRPVFLVAHSLGCLTVASWLAERGPDVVAGALLVAVPDASGPAFPAAATAGGFEVVRRRLPVPVTVVVSEDDPYAAAGWTRDLAAVWGAEVVGIGAAGHVNEASGVGPWEAGREILRGFMSTLGTTTISPRADTGGGAGR
ncbi:RBBP9/YdeN family alpha/beta hydrolase [Promicromonospora sp. NPDC060271]|uniref:RBBP9/YdeN family alpha/beta hydrolase n=1 Tax=Promicromonospora sp. NPDC060271 TaxID=3347089 RepID=UPI003648FDB2